MVANVRILKPLGWLCGHQIRSICLNQPANNHMNTNIAVWRDVCN